MTTGPRLRFAPSPTGPLHIGGARTALYNWAAARALGGSFILRIEDTDRARSTDESLQIILEGMSWLGLDWDEGPERDGSGGGEHGPYFQTERLEKYRAAADRLIASGHAYECFATPEEVEEGRQALVAAGKSPMYDRRHRDLSDDDRARLREERGPGSLRFRMPLDQEWTIEDLCKGPLSINLKELDDWVMVRPDGMPTYNFACVVDDADMSISHVVRGDEHTMNGFKQSVLFDALGETAPRYAHIPLILSKSGKKLSKRDAVTNLLEYRELGFLPDALFNYIALLGWSFSGDQDVFSREEFLERFKIEDIHSGGAKFDDQKLRWMNGDRIRKLDRSQFLEALRPYLDGTFGDRVVEEGLFDSASAFLQNLCACYQERAELLSEVGPQLGWVFGREVELDDGALKKAKKAPAEAKGWLEEYAARLEALDLPASDPSARGAVDEVFHLPTSDDSSAAEGAPCLGPKQIEADLRAFAEEREIPFGKLVHPLRAGLSGTTRGPGLADIVFLLGKDHAVARLRALASRLPIEG
ncbi:MAG: glutamate--tRNA ligase [Planctomycetota bacterium]